MQPQEYTELTELRTETAKHFDNGDDTKTAEIHAIPIHYQDSSGAFQDVKTDLVADTTPSEITQKVEEHELKVSLIDTYDQPTLYQRNGYPDLTLTPIDGSQVKGTIGKETTTYVDAYQSVDVEQVMALVGLKENIILKDAKHPNRFAYSYNTTLTPELQDNGEIHFKLKDEMVYRLTALYVTDSPQVRERPDLPPTMFQWVIDEKSQIVYYDVPEQSEYPVTIDPSVSPYSSAGDGYAGYVAGSGDWATECASAGNTSNYTNTTMSVSGSSFFGTDSLYRGFWAFDTSSIGSGNTVSAADFVVYCYAKASSADWKLFEGQQASTSTLANSDGLAYGSTAWSSAKNGSAVTTGAYNTWSLNSTGYGAVNITGYTKIAMVNSNIYNVSAPGGLEYIGLNNTETSGTSTDPYLSVTYSAGATFIAPKPFMLNQTIKRGSTI